MILQLGDHHWCYRYNHLHWFPPLVLLTLMLTLLFELLEASTPPRQTMNHDFQSNSGTSNSFYSRKRLRRRLSSRRSVGCIEGKKLVFRAASAVIALILTTHLLMVIHGFGRPSICHRRYYCRQSEVPSFYFDGTASTATIIKTKLFPVDDCNGNSTSKNYDTDKKDDDDDIDIDIDNNQDVMSKMPNDENNIPSIPYSSTPKEKKRKEALDINGGKKIKDRVNNPRTHTSSNSINNNDDIKLESKNSEDTEANAIRNNILGRNKTSSSTSTLLEWKERKFQGKKIKSEGEVSSDDVVTKDLLPSIADLFPTDLFVQNESSDPLLGDLTAYNDVNNEVASNDFSTGIVDGILPVGDLFYRSTQAIRDSDNSNYNDDGNKNNNKNYNKDNDDIKNLGQSQRGDEELPFSAEQSDQLTSPLNKIKIRRNRAGVKPFKPSSRSDNKVGAKNAFTNKGKSKKRKLQRRGMEMLVGGVPINADPPQRCVELMYRHGNDTAWNEVISTNTRDFGPMYYGPSLSKLSKEEQGLYCEFFANSTLKWNVCPSDLKSILNRNNIVTGEDDNFQFENDKKSNDNGKSAAVKDPGTMKEESLKSPSISFEDQSSNADSDVELSGDLLFSISVSKDELESSESKLALERVLSKAISTSSQCTEFDVVISDLNLSDPGDGTTMISAAFALLIKDTASMDFAVVKKKCNRINSALAQALDDGDMQLAMAAAAKKEQTWSEELRNRIMEEFLFDDDDGDSPLDEESDVTDERFASKSPTSQESTIDSLLSDLNYEVKGFNFDKEHPDVPFGMPGSPIYHKNDIFLGGGNDGVFWNYAADNAMNAPYKGKIGLRLVDAVEERAKQRHPRVIAIGDVHGCIDELQDLLRECNYRPGDIVVFLGDLVSKGPDSLSVVQMAREIGAIGVRGNHDFEVVRWHQAIKSGVDAPSFGSEHFHIANCLSKADMKWMYSLPWYISSPDLGALFVHAGFVSGIRLGKQNPRLMMNMRSILPDGTVTSKFFNNWPWARLWDGPQTVLFGHDADRGLQQYEHAIGLDTGCVYGGRLTACILEGNEKRLISVNAKREYFKYRRKRYD